MISFSTYFTSTDVWQFQQEKLSSAKHRRQQQFQQEGFSSTKPLPGFRLAETVTATKKAKTINEQGHSAKRRNVLRFNAGHSAKRVTVLRAQGIHGALARRAFFGFCVAGGHARSKISAPSNTSKRKVSWILGILSLDASISQ